MLEQVSFFEEPGFELLPLRCYDKVLISFSGGKDSLACILYILELAEQGGLPKSRIELWHQDVDGRSQQRFMDWPVTESYVKAVGIALGLTVRFQWRVGGFRRELLRENEPSQGIEFEDPNGSIVFLPVVRGTCSTRRKFPAKTADLNRRWCSAYLKADCFRRSVNNSPEFLGQKLLVITGERRQESPARSRYYEKELHPCNSGKRLVHWWRPVIDWREEEVWEIIKKHHIHPHPAYLAGWSRVSCEFCIFSTPDLWHMLREIDPEGFKQISEMEKELGFTIDNSLSVEEMANRGKSRIPPDAQRYVEMALGKEFSPKDVFVDNWKMPAGAFHGAEGGPC